MTVQRLGTALIGCGRWGRNVARVLAKLQDCAFVAVCDPDPLQLQSAPGAPVHVPRFDDVLADPSIQACVLCTPSALHAKQAISALLAGKHVFVEKPMALSMAEARAIAAAVSSSGRRLMVGHILLYHPACNELLRLAADGELGALRRIATVRTSTAVGSANEDPWWALAPHDVSWLLELIPGGVSAIRARRECAAGLDCVRAEIAFASGASAELTVGRGARRLRRITVFGDTASARFRDETPPGILELAAGRPDLDGFRADAARSLPVTAAEPLELELSHFVQSLLRRKPFRTDHLHGLQVTEVLAAGQESMDGDITVELSRANSVLQRASA